MNTIPIDTVLLIESNHEEARLIGEMFNHQQAYSFALAHVECIADAETYLGGHSVTAVLLDMDCPDALGIDAVLRIRAAAHDAPIVVLSNKKDEAIVMHTIESGVQDYLIKDQIEPHELMRALRNSMARKILERTLSFERNRAQITLECIGDAVICTDNDGNISFLNPTAEKMTGWSLT